MRSNKFNWAFLMLDVMIPRELQEIQNNLLVHDIYDNEAHEYGIELEPHITIYPCMDNDINILELLESLPKLFDFDLIVSRDALSAFTDMEGKDYDVLKLDIKSTALNKLHDELAKKYVSHSEFKEYHPHITIAYIKKGLANKYIHQLSGTGWLEKPLQYRFSWISKDGNKETILYTK
jgi:2'-5' RNA ligase